jgi:hypothetical protein
VIEEPANDQAGGDANEDLASRSWYLAALGWNIMWIHTRGARTSSDSDPISHMGRELISYPSLRCHVLLRNAWPLDDPVAPERIRQDNLQGNSVFVRIIFPFFLEPLKISNLLLPIRTKFSLSSNWTMCLLHTCAASIAKS